MSGDLWTAWKPKTPESNKSVALMSEVRHGNLIDHSSRVVLSRWWGLGILSLA